MTESSPGASRPPLKHRWSLAHNYLTGITAGDWVRLLRRNAWSVDFAYWHRAAFISATSLMNSCYRRIEERRFGAAIARTGLAGPPLFILGHWRNGTTYLHNLLAQDPQFAYANTYQVVNPHTFLCSEALNTRLFAGLVPRRRPMDNMALSFHAPQEDEFAPLLMTGLSPYLGITFPRQEDQYAKYLTFAEVSPDEVDEWKSAFSWFLQKLTLKYHRPLILKSPPHTARIALLLDMFPEARFVHIHREPYTVFRSTRHFFDTAVWYTYLQRPDLADLDDRIIRRYRTMYDAFFADSRLIPRGQFHEIRFEDLERDPEREIEQLYSAVNLPGFGSAREGLRTYIDSLKGYEKNRFTPPSADLRHRIAVAWKPSFDAWGYSA